MPGGRRNLQKEMRCLEHKRVDDRMRMLGGTCGGETKRGKMRRKIRRKKKRIIV
jgi:hypothetical protein